MLCPLYKEDCKQDKCAWWCSDEGLCVVQAISDTLYNLGMDLIDTLDKLFSKKE